MQCPTPWYEQYGIQRYGFHGASHRYAAEKVVELEGRADLKHVNMHLGGSSSLCAIKDGVSQGASHGLSPQGGLPQNNRIGDLDPYALDLVMRNEDRPWAEVLEQCASEGGCWGYAGTATCAILKRCGKRRRALCLGHSRAGDVGARLAGGFCGGDGWAGRD